MQGRAGLFVGVRFIIIPLLSQKHPHSMFRTHKEICKMGGMWVCTFPLLLKQPKAHLPEREMIAGCGISSTKQPRQIKRGKADLPPPTAKQCPPTEKRSHSPCAQKNPPSRRLLTVSFVGSDTRASPVCQVCHNSRVPGRGSKVGGFLVSPLFYFSTHLYNPPPNKSGAVFFGPFFGPLGGSRL